MGVFFIRKDVIPSMFTKFIYDSISSDEFGILCVKFGSPESIITASSEQSDLKLEKAASGHLFQIASQEYANPLQYTLQVMNKNQAPITQEEERALKKWLVKRGRFKPFFIYDKYYSDIWFFANINNPKQIDINGVYGLEFTVTTNSPFGYSDLHEFRYELNKGDSFDIYVNTDEPIPIRPDLEIAVKEDGTLILTNRTLSGDSKNALIIKNVSSGEVITIQGGYPKIRTSRPDHAIYSDFNLVWPTLADDWNQFAINISCTLSMSFREIRKVGIV